ncbi:MAG: response regulator transcription factor [Eubacteriales bacterium]|nr:response regulator transcription factor [Eubacteriales bacterium]
MRDLHDARILLVDDDPALLTMLRTFLEQDGFTDLLTAQSAADALMIARTTPPHILILDVILPDIDGFSLLQQLRTFSDVPALFLSAWDEDSARLKGLGIGADDYITKPFLPQELLLRLHAVLRRVYHLQDNVREQRIQLGSVWIDMETGLVHGNGDDKRLTAKEYTLLKTLNENRNRIVTVDALCKAAWEGANFGYENTLMVHMRHLREKIEPDPSHPRYLVTMRGLGYRLLREPEM